MEGGRLSSKRGARAPICHIPYLFVFSIGQHEMIDHKFGVRVKCLENLFEVEWAHAVICHHQHILWGANTASSSQCLVIYVLFVVMNTGFHVAHAPSQQRASAAWLMQNHQKKNLDQCIWDKNGLQDPLEQTAVDGGRLRGYCW